MRTRDKRRLVSSAVVFTKPTRPGPFELSTHWMRQPEVGEGRPRPASTGNAGAQAHGALTRPPQPHPPRAHSLRAPGTVTRVSTSLRNLSCRFLSPVPKVHSILMAFLFRSWACPHLGRGAPLS